MLLVVFLVMAENTQSVKTLWATFKKYVSLNVESAKLTATEKLTILFAAIAFYFVAIILGFVSVFFVSMALCHILSQSLEPHYVYFIMAAFYVVLLVVVYALRKALFLNPMSRFLSKLILNPPKED